MAAALNVAVLQLYYLVCTVFGGLFVDFPVAKATENPNRKQSLWLAESD